MHLESGATTLQDALSQQGLSESGLQRDLDFAKQLPCQVAAPVRLGPDQGYDGRTARFVHFCLLAGKEALEQSKLDGWLKERSNYLCDNNLEDRRARQRVGVCIGSGMSSVREVIESYETVQERGYRRLSPRFVPKVLSNSAAGRLSIEHGLLGPNHSASTACAAGSHAIGDAMRNIQMGSADVMLAGGAEACLDPLSMAGFCRLKALSTNWQNSPEHASRPFDCRRDGFVMAEGAAVLVLEELEHARARGAPLLAEIIGYGLSGDAHHITDPDPAGRGAEHAMRMALTEADEESTVDCESGSLRVQYVNAHATSTPKGDEIEARVVERVLCGDGMGHDPHPSSVYVSSTKGATGHLLGAAGALEAAFTVQALVDQRMPSTLNLDQPDEGAAEGRLSYVQGYALCSAEPLTVAMSNSFGFGGTNAALVFQVLGETK